MFFDVTLYLSLIIFGIGVLYKVLRWFLIDVGVTEGEIPLSSRIGGAVKAIVWMILSGRIFKMIGAFFVDVLLQIRIFKDKDDRLLWITHFLIFIGFLLLFLFHALDNYVTAAINENYQSTLNPNLFLRNLFGLIVIAGLVLAIIRRFSIKKKEIRSGTMDCAIIVILAVIIVSGFLLEGSKIISHSAYQGMVEEYADATEPEELSALEAYWVAKFGVVSPVVKGPFSEETLEKGQELHEMSCAACHSRPQSAFLSYGASRIMKPFAQTLEVFKFTTAMWYLHFMACFVGLAYLAFSKMFHIIATSVSLLIASVTKPGKESAANMATRQVIELDGCSHGGDCHPGCPVWNKRQERIELATQFEPIYGYVENLDGETLGNRKYD
jgi:nitrate reductase gamma subunit